MSQSFTVPDRSSTQAEDNQFDGAPLVFAPWYREQIWGGRNLSSSLKRELPTAALYGESWEISTHPLHVSLIEGGKYDGQPLNHVWERHANEISGGQFQNGSAFPFLLKFLDCERPVSIQVHPDDEIAQRLLGEPNGKSEAWVVLHSDPEGIIYSGFNQKVTKSEVEAAIDEGTLADLLYSFQPEPGDCLSIPAGIAHSVGHGVLILEIQQLSDATFRMFDWQRLGPDGKPRQLHIDESFESIDWSAGAVAPTKPQLIHQSETCIQEQLLDSIHFQISRHRFSDQILLEGGTMQAIACTGGGAQISNAHSSIQLSHGDVALLPVCSASWRAIPLSDRQCEVIALTPISSES